MVRRELRGAATALALLLSGLLLAVIVDFGVPGQEVLQSLRFHLAAVMALLVLGLLFVGAWRRAILFFVVLAISGGDGAAVLMRLQGARDAVAGLPNQPLMRVLSFNTLQSNGANGPRIADYIVASGVDVVVLTEANAIRGSLERIQETYPHRIGCDPGRRCDTLVLSKTRLSDVTVRSMSSVRPDRLVTATTEINGKRINIVAAHLVKPYFDDFAKQELHVLSEVIAELEGPLLLAGDFNAAAWSEGLSRLARDRSLMPPPAYPATWPVALGPVGLPIDNVFTRAPLVTQEIRAMDDSLGSNHRGLIASVSMIGG